jgi:hypothetical protein
MTHFQVILRKIQQNPAILGTQRRARFARVSHLLLKNQRNHLISTYSARRSNRNSIQAIVQKLVHTKQHNLHYSYKRGCHKFLLFLYLHSPLLMELTRTPVKSFNIFDHP